MVPDFVVQFGIASEPTETHKWKNAIPDDPVLQSNLPGTVSFATGGPNTLTTQIFINTVDNSRLDDMGFSPFAKVISGMDTVLAIYNPTPGDGNGASQLHYTKQGNEWILEKYPEIDLIMPPEADVNFY